MILKGQVPLSVTIYAIASFSMTPPSSEEVTGELTQAVLFQENIMQCHYCGKEVRWCDAEYFPVGEIRQPFHRYRTIGGMWFDCLLSFLKTRSKGARK